MKKLLVFLTLLLTTFVFAADYRTLEYVDTSPEVDAMCKRDALVAGALFMIAVSSPCLDEEDDEAFMNCLDAPIADIANQVHIGIMKVYNKCITELKSAGQ